MRITSVSATALAVAVVLTSAFAIQGCSRDTPVRIAVVMGGDGTDGARLAAQTVNAAGGVRGRPLELVVVAGKIQTSARTALLAADSLANDPSILAVIGHSNSSASLAASQIYNAAHVPVVYETP